MAKSNFMKHHLLALRDTLFFIVISLFPLSLIFLKNQPITWYIASGYIYGLVSASLIALVSRHRRTDMNLTIQMVKLVIVLSTFAMILMNKSTDVVKLDTPTFMLFGILFLCLYYETYRNKIAH